MVQGEYEVNRGTIIYAGGFVLPDKNAAANRVVANGKIFDSLGFRTVFLGAAKSDEAFNGIRPLPAHKNMFEQAHPRTSAEWIKRMFSVENIESLVRSYDDVRMIILYNAPFLTLLKAKMFFGKRNIKVCYDCTEWTKDTDGSFLKRAFKILDEFLVRNFADKAADGLIVISRTMELKYRKNPDTVLIPPLVDINNGIWHQTPESRAVVFEFCFAGVPDGNKESLDKAVQAFCRLNRDDARLRIIGVSKDEFARLYPDCVIDEKSAERIVFMGKLSHYETIKYVLNCDCYIFIRCSDRRNNAGFPTKFAEAFTCAVPIITTDVSDIGEYMKRSGKGTLLGSLSVEEIEAAMLFELEKGALTDSKSLDGTFHYESYREACRLWIERQK